jgi:outer membrane protein assembly factor BamA
VGAKSSIAARLMGGILYSYGNQTVAPYSEQFYIGGANSIRAFTVRSLGPGSFHPDAANNYGYIDQTGDIKLEANVEYRFPLLGDLYGATFLDAGNVWLLRKDEQRPGGQLTLKDFGKTIALGTGVGIRYDLTFLVVRLDLGIALHAPYETGKSGYYNIPKFKDGLGLHFAIGYPF